MASRPNPTSIRGRSGRLQAFARGSSDAQAHYNAPAPKYEVSQNRPETPHLPASPDVLPTKNEMAEHDRAPIPRVTRSQPQLRSPQKTWPQSPRKIDVQSPGKHKLGRREPSPELGKPVDTTERTHRSLFEGSELGEDFMNSGLTTPQNEPEDAYLGERKPEQHTKNANVGDPETAIFAHDVGNVPHFQWSDEGYMVVKSGPGRQSPSYLWDGFQNGGTKERMDKRQWDYQRPSSPPNRSKNLPIREVKLRRPRNFTKDDQVAKGRPRSPSPSSERPAWQPRYKERTRGTSMVINLDDDDGGGSQGGQDASHETPKAKKPSPPSQKTLMESSMPPVMNLNRHVQTKKRSRATPDYDDMALSTMSYTDLQREPFDLDPAQAAMQDSYRGDADPLTKKLDQLQHQADREQRSFFSNLSMEDWEQSGDWFVDRFSDIMKKLRDARRNKRRMIHEFETEASKHEEAVRHRSEAIDQKLVKMRQDGQRVVGDKVL